MICSKLSNQDPSVKSRLNGDDDDTDENNENDENDDNDDDGSGYCPSALD